MLFRSILTDFEAQGRLAAEVLQTVLRKNFAGLDVDFEYLPGQRPVHLPPERDELHRDPKKSIPAVGLAA